MVRYITTCDMVSSGSELPLRMTTEPIFSSARDSINNEYDRCSDEVEINFSPISVTVDGGKCKPIKLRLM